MYSFMKASIAYLKMIINYFLVENEYLVLIIDQLSMLEEELFQYFIYWAL